MAGKPQPISSRQVLNFLEGLNKGERPDSTELGDRQAYRHAAAVLAGIDDLDSLKPFGPVSSTESAGKLLGGDIVKVRAGRLGGKVMLSADVRRQALSELADKMAVPAALDANPKERTGPVQAQLESYLLGNAKPIEQQTLPELEDSLQVLLWLDGVSIQHPSLVEVRRRLEYLRLLAPFELLAGDAIFRGRQREMDTLRRYVGVVAPASLLIRLASSAFDWIKPLQQPALSVFGPGGVGKSALVARFMLEHARLPEDIRIPFAYLDFDRPALDIGRPLTLCVEMIRQLYLQFPGHENFGQMLEFVSKMAQQNSDVDQHVLAQGALADLLGGIENRLGPRPYVVTLDTFEEVQYRGEASAFPFWDMLVALQHQRPFLRVVISGRAPVTSLKLADKPANSLEIGSLDDSASVAFLQARGVDDPDLSAKIAAQVGGVPLSLKLAASLIQRDGAGAKGVRNLSGRSSLWFSTSDEMIQGQLFERILGHIHNPQVERLAHPGLVMRRITPEVILNVLNVPCLLAIKTIEEAQALFGELRSETALVEINQDEDEEELVHRPDLRRIMLKLLVQKSPAQVRDIHQRAVGWYSSKVGIRARAEELYHRLQLGEQVDKSVFDDRSIRFSIQASMDELPIESQLQLASYGLDVSKDVLERGSREQKEAGLAARIEQLLPYGSSSVAEAASIAGQLLSGANGAGPAYRAAARVAFQQGHLDQGLAIVEQGLSLAIPANETRQTLDLLREKAWALRGAPEEVDVLAQLNDYARRHQDKSAIVQHGAQVYAVSPTPGDLEPVSRQTDSPLAEIATLIGTLTSIQIWELVPALGLVIRELSIRHSEVLQLLGSKLSDETGPFQLVSFVDSRVDAARKALVNQAVGLRAANPPDANLAENIERLCSQWPYRILSVQPPYGSLGSRRLAEVVA